MKLQSRVQFEHRMIILSFTLLTVRDIYFVDSSTNQAHATATQFPTTLVALRITEVDILIQQKVI